MRESESTYSEQHWRAKLDLSFWRQVSGYYKNKQSHRQNCPKVGCISFRVGSAQRVVILVEVVMMLAGRESVPDFQDCLQPGIPANSLSEVELVSSVISSRATRKSQRVDTIQGLLAHPRAGATWTEYGFKKLASAIMTFLMISCFFCLIVQLSSQTSPCHSENQKLQEVSCCSVLLNRSLASFLSNQQHLSRCITETGF